MADIESNRRCVCVCVGDSVVSLHLFARGEDRNNESGRDEQRGWSVNGLFIDVYLFFNRKDEFVVDCGRPSEALASVSRSRIPNRRTGGRCYSLDWCFR